MTRPRAVNPGRSMRRAGRADALGGGGLLVILEPLGSAPELPDLTISLLLATTRSDDEIELRVYLSMEFGCRSHHPMLLNVAA